MEDKLVLKDGTEIPKGSASRMDNQLLITVPGNDIVNATLTFSNPEKTETIVCYYSVYKKIFTGFTTLYSVEYFEEADQVRIWLKGEDVSEETSYTVPEQYLPESMRTKPAEEPVTA